MRSLIAVLLPVLLALSVVTGQANPFHNGTESSCTSCHTPEMGLLRSDASSTCLSCHTDNFQILSFDGRAYTPAGDFYWLTSTYATPDPQGRGERQGHNVIAADFGLVPDSTLWSAPGDGTQAYQSAWLQCTSCHDPHTTARTNYRLLGSTGYEGGSLARGFRFLSPSPEALPCLGSDGELQDETDLAHPDYGSGMSEWCNNCHSGFTGFHTHPVGEQYRMGKLANHYNTYQGTSNLGGRGQASYDFLIPFERGKGAAGRLRCARTDGPTTDSVVMCLTCHRAHASAFSSIGRWDFGVPLLSLSQVLFSPDARHAYYGIDISARYGPLQESLCNKCHGKDKRE